MAGIRQTLLVAVVFILYIATTQFDTVSSLPSPHPSSPQLTSAQWDEIIQMVGRDGRPSLESILPSCHVRPVPPPKLGNTPKVIQDALAQLDKSFSVLFDTAAKGYGAYVTVTYGDVETIWSQPYGTVETSQFGYEPRAPEFETTHWPVASITKVFTDLLLLQLRDKGYVPSLDTPVVDIFPPFKMRSPFLHQLPEGSDAVTLRQLGSHLAGLPRECPCVDPHCTGLSTQEMLSRLRGLELILPTYSRASYSNLGFALLGRTLEEAYNQENSGEQCDYETLVEIMILRSLRMYNSTFDIHSVDWSVPRVMKSNGEQLPYESLQFGWDAPAGGLVSTARDMRQFQYFLNQWTYDKSYGEDTLSYASHREWTAFGRDFADGGATSQGMPWEAFVWDDYRILSKGGDLPGFSHLLFYIPSLRMTMMVFSTSPMQQITSYASICRLVEAFDKYLSSTRETNYLPPAVFNFVGGYQPVHVNGTSATDAPNITIGVTFDGPFVYLEAIGLTPPHPFLSFMSQGSEQDDIPYHPFLSPDPTNLYSRFRLLPKPDAYRGVSERTCNVLADGTFYNYLYFVQPGGGYNQATEMVMPGLHPTLKWLRYN